MFEFKHPKYNKELRKLRNKSDQAISEQASTEVSSVRSDPGHKQQASSSKQQASSEVGSKALKLIPNRNQFEFSV